MRTKSQYEAIDRFQKKYKDDPEFIHKQLEKFWNPLLKIKLNVKQWEEDIAGILTINWVCTIDHPKVEGERTLDVSTGLGGIKLYLEDISKEEFVLCYEVVYNGNPYDAGEFWDTIKQIK